MITWGCETLISLGSSTISLFLMVYVKSLFKEFFVVIISYGLFYHFVLTKLQTRYSKYVKNEQKKRYHARAVIQLKGVSFQYREDSTDDMISLYDIIEKTNYNSGKSWDNIGNINTIFLAVVSFLYQYYTINNVGMFLLLSIAIKSLTSSVEAFNHFNTQFERMKVDYSSFMDIYNDTTSCEDPPKQIVGTEKFHIKKVEICRGNYIIKLDPKFDNFVLVSGMKVLIEGPTGMGKSSLLKGLFGLLKDSTIDIRKSDNSIVQGNSLYRNCADYFQEIKERMPTSLITLRDFFKNEQDNYIIRQYLLNAWNDEEHDRILEQIKSKNPDIGDYTHPYDMYIHEALSGGQKSRLILWNRAYIAVDREIIILDEPIVDVDYDKYIQQLNLFFERYKHKIIFMIGHLCECKRKMMNVNTIFNMEIYVENGQISRRR